MKSTLAVYYSFEGNSEFAALTAAETCGADVQRLQVKKEPPRTGPGKFIVGGRTALFQEDPGLLLPEKRPDEYENIILAFPVWAGTFPPAVGAFLKTVGLKDKNVYLIVSSGSGNGDKAAAKAVSGMKNCRVIGTLNLQNPLKEKDAASEKIKEFLAPLSGT